MRVLQENQVVLMQTTTTATTTTATTTTATTTTTLPANGVYGKKLVYNNWVYSVLPEGEGPAAEQETQDKNPHTLPGDMEVVDVTQSGWQQILDNVIKPYGWTTHVLVVADTVQGTSPGFNSKNFQTPGAKWKDDVATLDPTFIKWTNQRRTFQFTGTSLRVLVRSRRL